MANTESTAALRPEIWEKELVVDSIDNLYFMKNGMMGEGTNNIVQLKTQLKKGHGDTVTIPLTAKLSGEGIDGDSELEGNEEAISPYSDQVIISQKRNAVRLTGKLDEKMNAFNMRTDAKNKLSMWRQEMIERQIFMKLGGVSATDLTDVNDSVYSASATWSNTATAADNTAVEAGYGTRYWRSGNSGGSDGLDDLAAGDVANLEDISVCKYKAMLASPKVVPLKIDGKNYYIMFVHPFQAYDIKKLVSTSALSWQSAQVHAASSGSKNPVFTGALGIWDGVILHEHEYVPTCQTGSDFATANDEAGVRVFRALLCGCQAAVYADAQSNGLGWVEEVFDYKNKFGVSTSILGGIQKMTFNSKDYGVVCYDSSASSDTT